MRKIFIGLALFIAGYLIALAIFYVDINRLSRNLTFGQELPDRVEVLVNVLSVDPIKGAMIAQVKAVPEGKFKDPATPSGLSTDLVLSLGEGKKAPNLLEKGKTLGSVETILPLTNGNVQLYPFDQYDAGLHIYLNDPKTEKAVIPILLKFRPVMPGFHAQMRQISDPNIPGYVGLKLRISRSFATLFFSIFIMFVMWFLAIATFLIALNFLLRKRNFETLMLPYMSAVLFVLPAVRNIQPGIPVLGTLSDFLAFFGAQLGVAISLAIAFYAWLTLPKKA